MSDQKQNMSGAVPQTEPATGARCAGHNVRRFHPIYEPAELGRAIGQLGDGANDDWTGDHDNGRSQGPSVSAHLTTEDAIRLRVLERLAADPRGHQRRSIIGSPDMVQRIAALSAVIPHFAPAIDLVARAALVSARTATPLRVPPILLLGEPGIGKSYALRRLAQAIGADFSLIAANVTDPFRLRGMNTAWRGAKPGLVAEILLGSSTAPVVLVDEFDKAVGDRVERPYDVWHSLLERENAAVFKDDFLEIELRADHITWFASANDVLVLPPSIVDRLLILKIPMPNREQLRIIIASIYTACAKAYGGGLPELLAEEVIEELARHNPRRIRRLLELAVGYAAVGGRRHLSVTDVNAAEGLVGAIDIEAGTHRVHFGPALSHYKGSNGVRASRPPPSGSSR